jgi:tRNA-Thr(GGU) m(6)t(6)A37 methyltransferase TsaA
MTIQMEPVAFVRGGRVDLRDDRWGGSQAVIELVPGIPVESLDGIETFSHAEVLFLFDRSPAAGVVTGSRHPRGNAAWPRVGIFAQRAKARPNRIGATIVRILGREGGRLRVAGLDAIDGTPVLDIKPVLAEFLPSAPVRQPQWSHELMRDYWTPAADDEDARS